jgi:pyocin large subunit-like protein
MTGSRVSLRIVAAAAVLLLGACDRGGETPAPEQPAPGDRADRSVVDTPREASREGPVARVDGKPMWAANRRYSAEENAEYQFKQHGEEFGAKDIEDFVKTVHAFTGKPPAGTERFERSNGDLLLYDPKTNVFAVVTEDGAPRTMFKPDDGAAYWAQQKTEASTRASRTARSEG